MVDSENALSHASDSRRHTKRGSFSFGKRDNETDFTSAVNEMLDNDEDETPTPRPQPSFLKYYEVLCVLRLKINMKVTVRRRRKMTSARLHRRKRRS